MSDVYGDIRKTILSNGLTVVLREMHHAPVASFWVWYRVGSRNEAPGITGISHWVEHMLFKGTPTYPQGQFDKLVAREGGVFNGMTWIDFTTYFETLPSDRIDLALRVESDRMVHAEFDPEETNLERTVIISERQGNENNPGFLLGEALQAAAFQAHSYHHSVIGWQADLESMTRDQLYNHYLTYYAPNNAVLALVGDLDTKDTLAKVKKYFGNIPRQTPPVPADLTEPARNEERHGERRGKLDDPLARLTRIDIAYRIPPSGTPDARALTAAASILGGGGGGFGGRGGGGGGNSSRLYLKLVQEKELVTNVSCNTDRRVGPGTFHISATLRPGKTPEEVEGLIGEEIARLHSEPVTAKELARVRISVRRGAESRITALSRAQALADAAAVFDDPNKVNTDSGLQLAVSAADIQRAAKAHLLTANRVVFVTNPAGGAQQGGRKGR